LFLLGVVGFMVLVSLLTLAVDRFDLEWIVPLVLWAVVIGLLMHDETRPGGLALLPMPVFVTVAIYFRIDGRPAEFYSAAAQVLPVLFLAALLDLKALSGDPAQATVICQGLLFLVAGELSALTTLADPEQGSPVSLVLAAVAAGFVSVSVLAWQKRAYT
jgi:uncharacterized membrane protein AbrB (regulator of aidB expression)